MMLKGKGLAEKTLHNFTENRDLFSMAETKRMLFRLFLRKCVGDLGLEEIGTEKWNQKSFKSVMELCLVIHS